MGVRVYVTPFEPGSTCNMDAEVRSIISLKGEFYRVLLSTGGVVCPSDRSVALIICSDIQLFAASGSLVLSKVRYPQALIEVGESTSPKTVIDSLMWKSDACRRSVTD
ncbi:hypothetical protein Trydic_g4163 [Trypoxylus dichotomus]